MKQDQALQSKREPARADAENAAFWDELCGTPFAKQYGITDDSPASLKRFDDWYFAYYPYLFLHIPFDEMAGKDVLEVGLGYGTVSQRIAESGAHYTGLDVAAGPVAMANHRLRQAAAAGWSVTGCAVQGSILDPPLEEQSQDFVVAIGCLHHTGDLPRAIQQCHRLLRPGGRLILMVYYAYSYRRWYGNRRETLGYLRRELLGRRGPLGESKDRDRAAYDTNTAGESAPHTAWISMRSLRHLCRDFKSFEARLENIDNGRPYQKAGPRRLLLQTRKPQRWGLDLYATAVK